MIKIYSGIEVTFKDEDFSKTGVVYCLTFENCKTYIGQTKQPLHKRMRDHCNKRSNCNKLKNAIQKYKKFSVSILSSNLDINQMNLFEQMFIKMFNSNGIDGYNLDSGGMNKTVSDETKRKLSVLWKGKKHTEETKCKMSKSQKGRTLSDETKRKMSESKKNISDETKQKMSEWQTGRTLSDKTRSKMSESSKGKNSKKVKSIPDNIIFNSILDAEKYYNISCLSLYYKGNTHLRSGQTFVLLEGCEGGGRE